MQNFVRLVVFLAGAARIEHASFGFGVRLSFQLDEAPAGFYHWIVLSRYDEDDKGLRHNTGSELIAAALMNVSLTD